MTEADTPTGALTSQRDHDRGTVPNLDVMVRHVNPLEYGLPMVGIMQAIPGFPGPVSVVHGVDI